MRVHFISIGGAAMHNLALALAQKKDYIITGSDDEIFDPAKTHLEQAGLMPDKIGWDAERITPDIDAIILGMHAREDNPELLKAKELGLKIYSFPEYLYEQTKDKIRIVVGGSHGKTTTTSLILYALKKLGIETDYMVGGQIEGFERMVSLSDTAKYAVFEGDEYLTSTLDRRSKFLWYHPHIALLTGIAWDHINVFPVYEGYLDTFQQFVNTIEPNGKLVYYQGDETLQSIVSKARKDITVLPYTRYDGKVPMQLFGSHNMQNLAGACLVCQQIGIQADDFFKAVSDFTGVDNRLTKIAECGDNVAYQDFAHSPSKLEATVRAVKERYPDKQVVACMELHTFSSLNVKFLPHYKNTMKDADIAFVYYNPHVVEHKRLTMFSTDEVKEAFATNNVEVFTDSHLLQERLRQIDYHNTVLLMMTSGTFDGMDLPVFMKDCIEGRK